MERDFEIIPLNQAREKQFGHNLTKSELNNLLYTDADWLKIIYKTPSKPTSPGLKYYIKKGAPVNDDVIQTFREKMIGYIPVLVEIDQLKHRRKLSDFAKQHSLILTGKMYGCVRDWLKSSGRKIEKGIDDYILQNKRELNNVLIKSSKDLGYLVNHVIKEVLYVNENLSVIALFEEFIDDINKYSYNGDIKEYEDELKHSLIVTTESIILGKRCGLDDPRLKELAFSALIHDIGKVISFERASNAFKNGKINPYKFEEEVDKYSNLHPTYGALLLTKRNGDTIDGLQYSVRGNILQHEQFIDGSGFPVYIPEQKNLLEKMKINENTRFFGFNKLPTKASEESNYKLVGNIDENAKRMTMCAQVLNVIESCVTKSKDKKKSLAEMIPSVGTYYNKPVFEVFFNTRIPIGDYPDGVIMKLKIKQDTRFENFNGYSVITQTKDNKKNFYLIKDSNENLISPKPIDLLSEKQGISFGF